MCFVCFYWEDFHDLNKSASNINIFGKRRGSACLIKIEGFLELNLEGSLKFKSVFLELLTRIILSYNWIHVWTCNLNIIKYKTFIKINNEIS